MIVTNYHLDTTYIPTYNPFQSNMLFPIELRWMFLLEMFLDKDSASQKIIFVVVDTTCIRAKYFALAEK